MLLAEVHMQPLISIDPWTMVMVAITFIVLVLLLKRFLWDKVRDFMQAREQTIVDAFDNAEQERKVAEDRLKEYSDKLSGIQIERRDILMEAKVKADENAKLILRDAEEKAAKILKDAREDIEREQRAAMQQMKEQVSLLAVYAAEQVIKKTLDEAAQREFIDGVIKEAETQQWKI
jgi:F-type H+-transporting ATPase subunit b